MISSPTKLAMFAFLLIVSVFVTIPAFPFQNEPEGFRGIKWGTNIAEFKDIELVESSKDTNYFRRKSDKMKIGDADIAEISYGF